MTHFVRYQNSMQFWNTLLNKSCTLLLDSINTFYILIIPRIYPLLSLTHSLFSVKGLPAYTNLLRWFDPILSIYSLYLFAHVLDTSNFYLLTCPCYILNASIHSIYWNIIKCSFPSMCKLHIKDSSPITVHLFFLKKLHVECSCFNTE